MSAIRVSAISTPPPTQRPKNHPEKDDPNDPISRAEKPGHRRLQVSNGDQRPLDDDRDRRQPKDSGQMGSICGLHKGL